MLTKAAYLFAPVELRPGRLVPRWLWLRVLGLNFLSAFYALVFQIHGLIGERGILPAARADRTVFGSADADVGWSRDAATTAITGQ